MLKLEFLNVTEVGCCLSRLGLLILQMMKVRLQQPSGKELAPFNPIHPPAAITQVMLLANPLKVGPSFFVFVLGGRFSLLPATTDYVSLPDNLLGVFGLSQLLRTTR